MNMHKRKNSEKGIVSFIVTLVMMLVISLVVIGFTQVTNRTQREALDRQLAAQAQYAAESGVNKVGTILSDTAIPAASKTKTDCSNSGGVYNSFNPTIDAANNVSVTCVLVNTRTEDIRVSANQTSSTIVPLNIVDSNGASKNASTLTFKWYAPTGQSSEASKCSNFGSGFPAEAGDCGFALLRVDLLNVTGPGSKTADDLMNSTTSFYMKPSTSGSTYVVNNALKGNTVSANCSSGTCIATLNVNNPNYSASSTFYARISTLYREAPTVIVDATTVSGSSSDAYFEGAQAVIDSTGKAQDVLKRIQVRYPIGVRHDDTVPPYALQSDDTICKKFTNTGSSIVDACNN